MKLALENAGAQRGVFLQERGGALVVEAEAAADSESVSVGPIIPLDRWTAVSPYRRPLCAPDRPGRRDRQRRDR